MSRATSAIGRDVSITIFTASSLNSCVNFLRRSGILHPPFRAGLYWIRCPESPRHATPRSCARASGPPAKPCGGTSGGRVVRGQPISEARAVVPLSCTVSGDPPGTADDDGVDVELLMMAE